MATAHAGLKRNYHQMRSADVAITSRNPSAPASREASPTPRATRSGFVTPRKGWISSVRTASFAPDASIVLVGLRGVGKSSLAVLAATAYNRQVIETEKAFYDATGVTHTSYRKSHGTSKCLEKHHQILRRLLASCSTNYVIVCGFSDLEHQGTSILAEYAQTHPVLHVTRDVPGIRAHLRVWNHDKVNQLLQMSSPILRGCSNFEFFNLTENLLDDHQSLSRNANSRASSGFSLTLKRVERDFLKLLRNIIGDHAREQSHHSAYPLSQFPVHARDFTLCATTTVEQILDPLVDMDALQIGIDAIEIEINAAGCSHEQIAHAFAKVRRATILPIILTVSGAGQQEFHTPQRAEFISYCLRLGPEYCTVDLDVEESRLSVLMSSKGLTRIIGHKNMPARPTRGWNDLSCIEAFEQAERLGCELCKITMPAHSLRDNFTAQGFREKVEASKSSPRLICYNTGSTGKSSLCFNKVLTPVGSTSEATTIDSADARITSKDAFQSLFSAFIYEPMKFFIYGANVSYSLSPAMHNAAYDAVGMRHLFGTHSSPTLDHFKSLAREVNFGGAAVVQPYKTGVLPLLDGLSGHAKVIGSVNTIVPVRQLGDDGSLPSELEIISQLNRRGRVKALYGYNTDWIGIRACLRRGLSPANTVRPQTTGLVCGAGGQARSTIYAMLSLGVRHIFICNRTKSHAQALADHYNKLIEDRRITELDPANASSTRIHVLDDLKSAWPSDFRHPTLIVSGIPTQNTDGSSIDFVLRDDWLKSPTGGVVVELAYRPMVTPIVVQMRAQAHKAWILMDGFDILPEQAFAQFELFTGRRAPRKLMRDQVVRHYQAELDDERLQGRNLDPNPPGR